MVSLIYTPVLRTRKDCVVIHNDSSRRGRPGTWGDEPARGRDEEALPGGAKGRPLRVSGRERPTALSATERLSKRTEMCQVEAVGGLSKSCVGRWADGSQTKER